MMDSHQAKRLKDKKRKEAKDMKLVIHCLTRPHHLFLSFYSFELLV
jgi:hypothetical protein